MHIKLCIKIIYKLHHVLHLQWIIYLFLTQQMMIDIEGNVDQYFLVPLTFCIASGQQCDLN